MRCEVQEQLAEAEELLKLMYRKNEAHRAMAKELHERLIERSRDANALRVHVQELIKHINNLVEENKKLRGCYMCCENDACMNGEEIKT